MNKKDLMEKVVEWLENEVSQGADVVNAKDNNDAEITSDGTDDIIYGRSECAKSLLDKIKEWDAYEEEKEND